MDCLALAYLNAVEVHIVFHYLVFFFSFLAAIAVALLVKSLRIVCDYIIDIIYPLLCLFSSRNSSSLESDQHYLYRPSIEKWEFFEPREIITDIDQVCHKNVRNDGTGKD